MTRTSRIAALSTVFLLLLSLAACATTSGTERTGGPQGYAQNPAEAKAQIDAVVAKNPALQQLDASGPASLAEAVEILRQDAFFRFDATSAYLATQPGVDALSLRALIEYANADVNQNLAQLVERRAQRDREAVQIVMDQKRAGSADAASERRAEELQARADEGARIARALKILFEHHLRLAKTLSEQAMAEHPEHTGGFLARAGVALLERDWLAFDTRIQQVEAAKAEGVGAEYMHAMERVSRFADIEGAAARLRSVLQKDPSFVRAQAKLLLTATDIEHQYAELQALRALSPQHLMVAVVGPAIDEEYRVAMEIRGARQGAAAPAAAPAAAAPAAPAAAPAP